MRRVYGYLFVLAVLSVCLLVAGCGGSSATALLVVTTTSLPNGTVASPYSATLTATGGTPPYTWSQTSGGAMPGGISVGSTGAFLGTPTVAGTFGPYIFKATDSNNLVASSVGLSIVVTASSLTISTTALPQATLNSPYSFALAASGGTPPYTWTETSGGALPPGLSNVTSAGVIAGTPTAAGTYGPYVFTVADAANVTQASQSLTLVVAPPACTKMGSEASLNSTTPYAFLLKGTDGSGNPINIAGSFTPDGNGGITAATVDYNGFSSGPEELQVNLAGSSYAFGSSTLGCLALNFTGPVPGAAIAHNEGTMPRLEHASTLPGKLKSVTGATVAPITTVQFSFSLSGLSGNVYNNGRIIESDNTNGTGTNASGFMQLQVPSAFTLASLQTNYAFGLEGWTATANGNARTAFAGTFTNTTGVLSAGFADLNEGGVASGELTGGSGTFSSTIDATTGRGTGTYTIPITGGTLTFDFAFYVLNASDIILFSIDSPISAGSAPLLAGRAIASSASYAAGPLNGYYLLEAQGLTAGTGSAKNFVEIGTLNATSAGAIPTALLYVNNAGSYAISPVSNGSYTVEAASGRVVLTGIAATAPVVYLTAPGTPDQQIVGFLVGADAQASAGVLVNQSATQPTFLLSQIAGNYSASTQGDVDGMNGAFLGAFSFTGSGQYLATEKVTGTVPTIPSLGTIAISADGSGNLAGGNFPLVTNGQVIFAIPDSGDPLLYILMVGTPIQ